MPRAAHSASDVQAATQRPRSHARPQPQSASDRHAPHTPSRQGPSGQASEVEQTRSPPWQPRSAGSQASHTNHVARGSRSHRSISEGNPGTARQPKIEAPSVNAPSPVRDAISRHSASPVHACPHTPARQALPAPHSASAEHLRQRPASHTRPPGQSAALLQGPQPPARHTAPSGQSAPSGQPQRRTPSCWRAHNGVAPRHSESALHSSGGRAALPACSTTMQAGPARTTSARTHESRRFIGDLRSRPREAEDRSASRVPAGEPGRGHPRHESGCGAVEIPTARDSPVPAQPPASRSGHRLGLRASARPDRTFTTRALRPAASRARRTGRRDPGSADALCAATRSAGR